MRVLLIEDDSAMAKSIELMLQNDGFNIYTTDLGEEGLDLGKLYDYDIIVLDLNLPDMHGYEVLKKLRMSKVDTPILILSGMAEPDDQGRKAKAGDEGRHQDGDKPFTRAPQHRLARPALALDVRQMLIMSKEKDRVARADAEDGHKADQRTDGEADAGQTHGQHAADHAERQIGHNE